MYHPIKAANIIYSCCVLHNIAIKRKIELVAVEDDDEEDNDEEDDPDNIGLYEL